MFSALPLKSRDRRLERLDRTERMMFDHRDAFFTALHQDFGKPPFVQVFVLSGAGFDHASGYARRSSVMKGTATCTC